MTSQQLAILNSLVTYAAENVPGGLSEDESKVARIVGKWTLTSRAIPAIYSLRQVQAILMYGRLEGAPATAEEVVRNMIQHGKLHAE